MLSNYFLVFWLLFLDVSPVFYGWFLGQIFRWKLILGAGLRVPAMLAITSGSIKGLVIHIDI